MERSRELRNIRPRLKDALLIVITIQSAHGFDRTLRLVATRREDSDSDPQFIAQTT